MPEGVVPDEGLARGLFWTLDNPDTQLDAWQLLLFVNDFTPGPSTTLADLVEPSWTSYVRAALIPAAWSEPTVSGNVATSEWGTDPVEFLNVSSATETVYGCAYWDPIFAVLRFAQRFESGDIRPIAAGESILIIPRFTRRGTAA